MASAEPSPDVPAAPSDLTGCTIARHLAEDVSGILALGKCRLAYCTLADNVSTVPNYAPVAPNVRGEVYGFPQGATLHVGSSSVVRLQHCTISGNRSRATAGIQIFFVSKLYMKKTVVAGNISTRGELPDVNCVADGGDVESLGHCFIGGFTPPNTALNNRGYRLNQAWRQSLNGDQLGTRAAPLDPMLAPLGNYGAPVPTMPPLPGSPLIKHKIGAAEFISPRAFEINSLFRKQFAKKRIGEGEQTNFRRSTPNMEKQTLPFLKTAVLLGLLSAIGMKPASGQTVGVETFAYPDGPIADLAGGQGWDYDWLNLDHEGTSSDWDEVSGSPSVVSRSPYDIE